MRNFKKVVAGLLALLMLALSVNVTFAAEEYTEKEAVVVAKVNAAGIMQGTDKGFEPAKTLTRAEAAAIMVRMKNISESTVAQNAGTTLFTDVAASHWAAGYINVASNYGIIKGVGANKFAPEKEVTVAEFYTMAIRALNAGQLVEAEGTWPTNYVNFAIENDLAEDVAQLYSLPATRMTAATIIANTLEATLWTKSGYKSNGEVTFEPNGGKLRETVLKIYEVKERTITVSDSKKNKGTVSAGEDETIPTEFNEKTANLGSVKAGQKYTVWYNKDEVLGFWVKDDSKKVTFTDIKDAVAKNTNKVTFVVDGEEKDYDIKSNATVELNGDVVASIAKPTGGLFNVFGTMYLDNEGKVTAVYAEQYQKFAVVKEVKNDRIYLDSDVVGAKQTTTIVLALKDTDKTVYKVTKDGKGIDVKDIEEGDAIYFYVDDTKEASSTDTFDTYVIEVLNDTVEGKVTAKAGTDKITIDGTSYKLTGDLTNTTLLKAEGTFYLNDEGKIAMYKLDEVTTDYAVIASLKYANISGAAGEEEFLVKLGYTDGTVSDWLQFHKDDAYHKDATKINLEDKAGKVAANSEFDGHYKVLGTLVKYEMKGGKVILTAPTEVTVSNILLTKNDGVQLNTSSSAYLNSSSIVVERESNDEEKYEEVIKLNVLNADDLDEQRSIASGVKYVAKKDHADEVEILIFDEDASTIKADKTWAFILDETPYGDIDNDDLAYKYDVVYAAEDGDVSKTTLYGKSTIGSLKGKVVELTVEDNIIKAFKAPTTATHTINLDVAAGYAYANETDYIKTATVTMKTSPDTDKINTITASDRLYLDDEYIVVSCDKDDISDDEKLADAKFEISKLGNIDYLTDKSGDTITSGTDKLLKVITVMNSDNEEVVVAVVYNAVEAN